MSNKNKLNQLKSISNSTKEEICISLVGPVGCGKSALIVKYLTRRFIGEYDPFYEGCWTKIENVDNVDMNVQIMDTYDKLRKNLEKIYKWSDLMLVVYSITDNESFILIQDYLEHVNEIMKKNQDENDKKFTKVVLLGNKIDMERYRRVNKNDVESLIKKYNTNSIKKISDSTNTIINDINNVNNSPSLNLTHVESTSCEDYDLVQNLFHKLIRETKREKDLYQTTNQPSDDSHNVFLTKFSKNKFSTMTKSNAKSPKSNSDSINQVSTSPPIQTGYLDSNSNSLPTSNSFCNISGSHSAGINNFTLNSLLNNKDTANKKNSSKFPFFNKILNKS